MNRITLLAGLLVVVGLGAPAAGFVAQTSETGAQTTPGEQFAGVVEVQSAELNGELDKQSFAVSLDRADDNATKASRIAEQIENVTQRIAALEERTAQLTEQHENGTISEGKYRAQIAVVAAERNTLTDRLNQTDEAAATVPRETLEANGVNVTAIETLRQDASRLGGEEVAAIARGITGDRPGAIGRDRGERDEGGTNRPGADRGGTDNATGEADSNGTNGERSDAAGKSGGENTSEETDSPEERATTPDAERGESSETDPGTEREESTETTPGADGDRADDTTGA